MNNYIYTKTNEEKFPNFSIKGGSILLPRNRKKFERLFKEQPKLSTISNPFKEPLQFKNNFSLKNYQKKVLEEIKKHHSKGVKDIIVEAGTGFGKSYMMSAYIKYLNQKTLILVDMQLLAEQMFNEISTNLDCSIQKLSKDSEEFLDVNISTLQLLHKNPLLVEKLSKEIGSVIVDEVHIIPAGTFKAVLQNIPSTFRLGLSATPFREDGLTEVIYDLLGEEKVIGYNEQAMKCHIHNLVIDSFVAYNNPLFWLQELESVLKVLIFKKNRRVLLILNKKVEQVSAFHFLEDKGFHCRIVNGDKTSKEREEIFQEVEKGTCHFLIALKVLEKGISLPRLDTCISLENLTEVQTIQVLGRLRREHRDKQIPLFINCSTLYKEEDRFERSIKKTIEVYKDVYQIFKDLKFYKRKWNEL